MDGVFQHRRDPGGQRRRDAVDLPAHDLAHGLGVLKYQVGMARQYVFRVYEYRNIHVFLSPFSCDMFFLCP